MNRLFKYHPSNADVVLPEYILLWQKNFVADLIKQHSSVSNVVDGRACFYYRIEPLMFRRPSTLNCHLLAMFVHQCYF